MREPIFWKLDINVIFFKDAISSIDHLASVFHCHFFALRADVRLEGALFFIDVSR